MREKKFFAFIWKHKTAVLAIIAVVAGITAFFRMWDTTHWADSLQLSNTSHYRTGAESEGQRNVYFNFCDQGFFRLDGGIMNFYSADHNRTFPLCTKAHCRHEDDSCDAWYDTKRPVKGLGTVDGSVYAAFWNEEKSCYEFCSLQLNGKGREVIADIPVNCFPHEDMPDWFDAAFRIAYTPGKAWITDESTPGDEKSPGIATEYVIDLTDGSMTCVTTAAISLAVTEARAITHSDAGILFDLWYFGDGVEVSSKDFYLFYAFETGEFEAIEEIERVPVDGDGGYASRFTPLGEWEDGLIVWEKTPYGAADNSQKVYYWNLETNTREELFTIEDGTIPQYNNHNVYDSSITANDEIYYCEYERVNGEKEKARNHAFSLMIRRDRELYTDAWDFPYRLEGESGSQWLYGNGGNGMENLSRIRRSQYEVGQYYYQTEFVK